MNPPHTSFAGLYSVRKSFAPNRTMSEKDGRTEEVVLKTSSFLMLGIAAVILVVLILYVSETCHDHLERLRKWCVRLFWCKCCHCSRKCGNPSGPPTMSTEFVDNTEERSSAPHIIDMSKKREILLDSLELPTLVTDIIDLDENEGSSGEPHNLTDMFEDQVDLGDPCEVVLLSETEQTQELNTTTHSEEQCDEEEDWDINELNTFTHSEEQCDEEEDWDINELNTFTHSEEPYGEEDWDINELNAITHSEVKISGYNINFEENTDANELNTTTHSDEDNIENWD